MLHDCVVSMGINADIGIMGETVIYDALEDSNRFLAKISIYF